MPPGRYLGRRIVDQSPASAFDGSVSADRQDSFGNRFGNGISSSVGNTPPNPNQPAPEPGPLLGIFSGKPMSPMRLPPSVWGLPDNFDASSGDRGSIFWRASLPRVRDSLSYCRKLLAASRYLSRRSTEQSRTSLPRRANHRHIVIIARIEPASGNRPRAFA
jgi:hypothetical protein